MTTCLGKSCSFGLPCVYFVNVNKFCVFHSIPFGIEDGMWDVILLISYHCLSIILMVYFREFCYEIITKECN